MFSRKKSHSDKKTAQPLVKPVIHEPVYAPEPVVQQQTYEAPAPQVQQLPDLDSSDAILAAQGAALQNHNRDLVKRLSELKDKRDELDNAISAEESEKDKYEDHLRALQDRLQEVVEGLHKKMNVKSEVERVIVETESAYNKLVESSHSLLGLLERETLNIQKERKTEMEHLV